MFDSIMSHASLTFSVILFKRRYSIKKMLIQKAIFIQIIWVGNVNALMLSYTNPAEMSLLLKYND